MWSLVALLAQATAPVAPRPRIVFREPPMIEKVTGPIESVLVAPMFSKPFACIEHFDGQMEYAGDALGTDCMVVDGLNDGGFMRFFRTDGKTNEDWYGWGQPVMSPVDGKVVGVFANARVNVPGTMSRPPAGMLQIERADGVTIMLGHVSAIKVEPGQIIKAGDIIATVGNNGQSRAPHIHIGAARGRIPLQIRWDQRAIAKYQQD